MRKPVCLAVIAISIVVTAVSLGVTLTRYLGLRSYTPKGAAESAAAATAPGVSATPPERWNNLFAPADGMKLASRLPAVNVKTAAQAPRSTFVLVGTIVSSTSSARRAILWANGMKQPKAFREKEEVEPGAILASVERDKVWITRGNEREKLELLPVGSRVRSTATAAQAGAPTVGGEAPLAAFPADASTLPWVAPGQQSVPASTPAVATPKKSSEDEEEEHLSPRQKRRRAQGLRR